jgi:Holliday junction resolvase RusA-like endonuclease
MTPITITIDGAPVGKARPRVTRAGIAFTPAATRSYGTHLAWAAQAAMVGRKPLTGPLRLTVEAFLPVPRSWSQKRQRAAVAGLVRPTGKPDLDNVIKNCDALNAIVWTDDTQVVAISASKRYSDKPRLVLTIDTLDGEIVTTVAA